MWDLKQKHFKIFLYVPAKILNSFLYENMEAQKRLQSNCFKRKVILLQYFEYVRFLINYLTSNLYIR